MVYTITRILSRGRFRAHYSATVTQEVSEVEQGSIKSQER
jgi:hypothetical protein